MEGRLGLTCMTLRAIPPQLSSVYESHTHMIHAHAHSIIIISSSSSSFISMIIASGISKLHMNACLNHYERKQHQYDHASLLARARVSVCVCVCVCGCDHHLEQGEHGLIYCAEPNDVRTNSLLCVVSVCLCLYVSVHAYL